jgi:hypothetical protein
MKVKELIRILEKYENEETEVLLKLIPNDGSEADGDENDLDVRFVGEIYTGGLDSDEPFVELGFQVIN